MGQVERGSDRWAPAMTAESSGRPLETQLSIVVAYYDPRGHHLEFWEQLLTSLDASDVIAEVILVDNFPGSPPTGDVEASAKVRLRRVSFGENLGYGRAMNRGAAIANGEVLIIANQDVRVSADTVKGLLEAVRATSAATAVVSPVIRLNPTSYELGNALPGFLRTLVDLLLGNRFSRVRTFADTIDAPATSEWISAAFVAVTSAGFASIGGFSEDYFLYAEDLEFFRRLHGAGGRLMVDRRYVVDHEPGFSLVDTWRQTLAVAGIAWMWAQPSNGLRSELILRAGSMGALVRSIVTRDPATRLLWRKVRTSIAALRRSGVRQPLAAAAVIEGSPRYADLSQR